MNNTEKLTTILMFADCGVRDGLTTEQQAILLNLRKNVALAMLEQPNQLVNAKKYLSEFYDGLMEIRNGGIYTYISPCDGK